MGSLTLVQYSAAVLFNGLGRYQEALDAAEQGAAYPQELAFANWSLVELIEAAVPSGRSCAPRVLWSSDAHH